MDLYGEKGIRTLLGRHDFRFSKNVGQNFLIKGWVPRGIAETSGAGPDTGVLEVGPGVGSLTVQLARRAAKVAAIELDRTLCPILAETLAPYPNAEVMPGNAVKLDLATLVSDKSSDLTAIVYADLPHSITMPVLTVLIEAGCFASITVMIQRKVALRIYAAPGSSGCGAFSMLCRYRTQPELLFEVGPECFLPTSKVTSAVIRLVPHSAPPQNLVDGDFFFQVVGVSFTQRRKTLLSSLSSTFGGRLSKDALCRAIRAAGLPADIWSERLGTPESATLASALQNRL